VVGDVLRELLVKEEWVLPCGSGGLRGDGLGFGSSKTRVNAGLPSGLSLRFGVRPGLGAMQSIVRTISDNASRNSPALFTRSFKLFVSKLRRELNSFSVSSCVLVAECFVRARIASITAFVAVDGLGMDVLFSGVVGLELDSAR